MLITESSGLFKQLEMSIVGAGPANRITIRLMITINASVSNISLPTPRFKAALDPM
jgi:hypothetical protein